jgi:hypothetical protein
MVLGTQSFQEQGRWIYHLKYLWGGHLLSSLSNQHKVQFQTQAEWMQSVLWEFSSLMCYVLAMFGDY